MSDLERKAMEIALEALGEFATDENAKGWVAIEAMQALRQALAQPDEVLAEREACAQMVDHILKEGGGTYGDAIRARGEK